MKRILPIIQLSGVGHLLGGEWGQAGLVMGFVVPFGGQSYPRFRFTLGISGIANSARFLQGVSSFFSNFCGFDFMDADQPNQPRSGGCRQWSTAPT